VYSVPAFIELENWPSSSLYLNLVDYCICNALQQLTYWLQIQDILHPKDVPLMRTNSHDFNDQEVGQFWKRPPLIIAVNGSHVERFLISDISTVDKLH